MKNVIIEQFGDDFYLYNEAGCVVDGPEPFESYEDAEQHVYDNNYKIVDAFFI